MMGAGWVAGSVRARLLAHHCLGPDGVRDLAMTHPTEAAFDSLRRSAYGRAVTGARTVADAQDAIWATVLWDIRVLAGWLPPAGVGVSRVFAGFFEIENIERRLVFLEGGDDQATFELGSLGSVWTRVHDATSILELRDELAASAWRDPGSTDRARMMQSLRLEWARQLSEIGAPAAWGAAAAALVLARALMEPGEWIGDDIARRVPMIGRRPLEATTLAVFVASLPDLARWVFAGIGRPDDLWRAEAAWWRRFDDDGRHLLHAARSGPDVVVGAVARRMADAWRTCAALELASRGARTEEELIDVVA